MHVITKVSFILYVGRINIKGGSESISLLQAVGDVKVITKLLYEKGVLAFYVLRLL